MWIQRSVVLRPYPRGFHLITREVCASIPELSELRVGMLHVFLQHTSASLTINENADPTVRMDFETFFKRLLPENTTDYLHNYEGVDDMPAHIKASLLGCSIQIPIQNGELKLGTWQGIYLGEHRNNAGARRIVISLFGS
ncbi:MAG: hypothetical protein RLZZ241_2543 [Bacteroidota bacterium]|jgi:secondary thiamine-phosphate synthase enzyme